MRIGITLLSCMVFLLGLTSIKAQQRKLEKTAVQAVIDIDINQGHELVQGASGFNVRIGDKVWNYTHPDFRRAVHEAQPGWLRYFSGTMGDAFSSATGQYDLNFARMFDKQKMYLKGHMFTEIKGPHRIIDLYHLLGEVGGKLVVTVNAFAETPEMTAALARFCKNNHIEVEAWQFCNEPFFFFPRNSRKRYWWNDGHDYVEKMKPHAEAILEVYPNANLALMYVSDWDGTWSFMKDIHEYQKENDRFWNVFSKHSYAPRAKEPFDDAYRRANSKIVEVTGKDAMNTIENHSWKKVPLLITEYGVWNPPLNGIYSAIYNVEYTLRQMQHDNLFLIASHELSNKFRPARDMEHLFYEALETNQYINSDSIQTGVEINDEGRAFQILHEATNNATYTWNAEIKGAVKVPGMDNIVEATYARAFKGVDGFNYLAITNRSKEYHDFTIRMAGKTLNKTCYRKYIWSETAQNKDLAIQEDTVSGSTINVPPHSVMLLKWDSEEKPLLTPTRIYKAEITSKGVRLDWWQRDNATEYIIRYGENKNALNKEVVVKGKNSKLIENVERGKFYYFSVTSKNAGGISAASNEVSIAYKMPKAPEIFKTAREGKIATVFWRSVANANGYKIRVTTEDNSFNKEFDADNVFGYRIRGLEYDKVYNIQVIAYNGIGESMASGTEQVICKENLPIGPRQISAKRTDDNKVRLEWTRQDSVSSNVRYRVYRGSKPHHFSLLAEDIRKDFFVDNTPDNDECYYTVKAYNEDGENDFYPNIATVINH